MADPTSLQLTEDILEADRIRDFRRGAILVVGQIKDQTKAKLMEVIPVEDLTKAKLMEATPEEDQMETTSCRAEITVILEMSHLHADRDTKLIECLP